jgi:hypothetical protein
MSKEIIVRRQAKYFGLKRYYTGKTCKNGHIDERYTSDSRCVTCVKETHLANYDKNKERMIERTRRWQMDNHEQYLENQRRHYRKKNPYKPWDKGYYRSRTDES